MKKLFVYFIFLLVLKNVSAQNIGIGNNNPKEKLHVVGNLIVQQPYVNTNANPTGIQTQTMVNGNTSMFLDTDSTGRLYDPGGPLGNYLPNLSSSAFVPVSNNLGFEITIEDIQLNTGDSLIIKGSSGMSLLRLGKDNSATGKYIFNAVILIIDFISNSDGNTGRGFGLLFKRLYGITTPPLTAAFGNALFFDAGKGSFRAGGLNSELNIGDYSTALGYSSALGNKSFAGGSSDASADYATAFGSSSATKQFSTAMGQSTSNGDYSTAMGQSTASNQYSVAAGFSTATGYRSVAIGDQNTATSQNAMALGNQCTASSAFSIAIGNQATSTNAASNAIGFWVDASGAESTAMGNYVSTNNKIGSFIIGDAEPGANSAQRFGNDANNQMMMRFVGGYKLYTAGWGSTIGAQLTAGATSWSAVSDKRRKENFIPVNGESVLQKIRTFSLTTWNYKTLDVKTQRHYGPMAQDFYAAFGNDRLGKIGCDTLINEHDFSSINFIAIQALEKRTQKINVQQQQIENLQKENEILKIRLKKLEKIIYKK
jgi:hypothetical protein